MHKSLKTLGWWALGTVAAVPITKAVESHFDVSLFSPAISGLWGWLLSVGHWFARDVTFPLWLILLLCLLILILLVPASALIYVRWFEKEETPKGSPLTDDQQRVFVVVGKSIQEGHRFNLDHIRELSGLSRIATQTALDHLLGVGLIRQAYDKYGFQYADLTRLGREHYLELEGLLD
ncbi:hypothetical protein [Pseudomonas sp. RIT-To-2]|uniref:hypothetical protein n=1 Tax=Pseudomonas sp. RIT-To-2 TaxID=3462541 RepID=UPI002413242B